MKIKVAYKNQRFEMDIEKKETVHGLRNRIKDALSIYELICPKSVDLAKLQLLYNGVVLQDEHILYNLGVKSGDLIKCSHIEKPKVYLRVHIHFLKRIHKIREPTEVRGMTVETLKSNLQNKIGIPVSCFRLLSEDNVPLFDCNTLGYYDITEGSVIHMETWSKWTTFLVSALNGDLIETFENIPSFAFDPVMNRYQYRVALFIAAHMDHTQLAAQLMHRGAR